MKKWQAWAFIVLLIAIAVTTGWLRSGQSTAFADANIEADHG